MAVAGCSPELLSKQGSRNVTVEVYESCRDGYARIARFGEGHKVGIVIVRVRVQGGTASQPSKAPAILGHSRSFASVSYIMLAAIELPMPLHETVNLWAAQLEP